MEDDDGNATALYTRVVRDVLRRTRDQVLVGLDEHSVEATISRLHSTWLSHLASGVQPAPAPEPAVLEAPAGVSVSMRPGQNEPEYLSSVSEAVEHPMVPSAAVKRERSPQTLDDGVRKKAKVEKEEPVEEDIDVLGSDLDDDEEDIHTDNVMLCQFTHVRKPQGNKKGGKWKCELKDGVMRVEDTDYVFTTCSGNFNFFWD